MPVTKVVPDALGVVTITLVAVLALLGFLCILYTFYFHTRIRSQGFVELAYFSRPWVIRITFILFAIWWGFGEILRLSLLRRKGRLLHALNTKWQENICKGYIVSNLGFAEPCLFLTLVFLLRASLQRTDAGTLSQKWNLKTAIYVLLFCLPLFLLQLVCILLGAWYEKHEHTHNRDYFFKIMSKSRMAGPTENITCSYPLLSTIFLGLFATVLTAYLFWLGRRILSLVINKGLQRRVCTLIFSASGFFPMRVLLLGLSILSKPEDSVSEILVFLAFLSLFCCASVGVCVLVYFPIADSLALRNLHDIEARRRIIEEHNETLSLIANQSYHNESSMGVINRHGPGLFMDIDRNSPGRHSAASTKRGSISFRTMERSEVGGAFVELSLFSPSQHSTPGSPQLLGWPMLPQAQPH